MKSVLVALCFLMVPVEAHAISRYNSMSMTCSNARAVIRQEGAALMRWRSPRNPSIQRFGRFVRNDFFCSASERAEFSFIPTKDQSSCRVLECKPWYRDDDDFWWRRRW